MKKWLIGLLVLCMFTLAAIYIFIPQDITVTHFVKINSNFSATNRGLHDNGKWLRWWPKNNTSGNPTNNVFTFNGTAYIFLTKSYNSVSIDLKSGPDLHPSKITVFPISVDSVGLEWQTTLQASINPWKRIVQFEQAKKIKSDMVFLMERLSGFLEKKENIYGVGIKRETIKKDTLLVSTKSTFGNYPSTANVYALIEKLRVHLLKQGVKETGYPMLNITQTENNDYTAQVAIPVSEPVKPTNDIVTKQMPLNGYILTATITGGSGSIRKGMSGMEDYISDYQKSIIAIPFESLVTDRSKEPDTSKWVTKIYYPVTR